MSKEIHVEIQAPRERNGTVRISANVSGYPGWPRVHRRNGEVFFDIPASHREATAIQGRPDDVHDVFARAALFTAMEARRPLRVHGNVSRGLIENLEQYQRMIHGWWPRFRPVAVRADAEIDPAFQKTAADRNKAVICLSGGMDSIYSLHAHLNGLWGEDSQTIGLCLLLRGFDVHFSHDSFADAIVRTTRIAESVNVPVVPMATNIRLRSPAWAHSHGAAQTACLSVFERGYSAGVIAPSYHYEADRERVAEMRHGATPWSDPLLSSAHFRVVHDRPIPRDESVLVLRDWVVARQNLRVCFKDVPGNCSVCLKCLLRMGWMKYAGIDDMSSFDKPYEVARFLGFDYGVTPLATLALQQLQEYAEKSEFATEEDLHVLRKSVDRAEKRLIRRRLRSIGFKLYTRYIY